MDDKPPSRLEEFFGGLFCLAVFILITWGLLWSTYEFMTFNHPR